MLRGLEENHLIENNLKEDVKNKEKQIDNEVLNYNLSFIKYNFFIYLEKSTRT